MIRAAMAEDAGPIEAFLAGYAETSMFLRTDLARASLSPDRAAGGQAAFWRWPETGPVQGVIGLTENGYGMLQVPGARPSASAVRLAMAGRQCVGMTGVPDQISWMRAALGLSDVPADLDRTEPLYRLDLRDLTLPDAATALRGLVASDAAWLVGWRVGYLTEIMGARPGAATEALAAEHAGQLIAGGRGRVLTANGVPVALTAFNAVLPDMVQVGSVFTPPALRGLGHARRAVALHLAEARAAGVATGILFASGPAACRAYEAIGFRRNGAYHLLTLASPVEIGA